MSKRLRIVQGEQEMDKGYTRWGTPWREDLYRADEQAVENCTRGARDGRGSTGASVAAGRKRQRKRRAGPRESTSTGWRGASGEGEASDGAGEAVDGAGPLVSRVRCRAALRVPVHARRANLHLHQPAARQEHRVVQRLVAVLLGRGDVVLVVVPGGAPETVDGPHRGVAALLVVSGDQEPHRQDVPRLLAPSRLGEGREQALCSVLHTDGEISRESDVLLQLERRVLQSRPQLSRRAVAALPPVVKRAESAGRCEGEDGVVASAIDGPLQGRGEQRAQCRPSSLLRLGYPLEDAGALRERGRFPRAGMRPRQWFALARMGAGAQRREAQRGVRRQEHDGQTR